MKGVSTDGEVVRLRSQVAALDQLLAVQEQLTLQQAGRLEQTIVLLKESEAKFRQICASAQDAILMMDSEGKISYWNPAATEFFGYSEQEAYGRDLHGLIVPEQYHAAFQEGFERFKTTGQGGAVGKTLELTALRKDGTQFPVELSLSGVEMENEWHAIGIVRDITRQKQMEADGQEAERSRVLIEAAGAAAHEINQPLTVILGLTQIHMGAMAADDPLRPDMKAIYRAGQEISETVKKMQTVEEYATKPYRGHTRIVDFDTSAGSG